MLKSNINSRKLKNTYFISEEFHVHKFNTYFSFTQEDWMKKTVILL